MMKIPGRLFILMLVVTGGHVYAQTANDESTQNAIIAAIPDGLAPETASADDIALAARTVAFNMEGDLNTNLTQVMVSLGELTREGVFTSAPRSGNKSPTLRFYNSVLNLTSSTNMGVTPQYITGTTDALVKGMNFLNAADNSTREQSD